MVNRAFDQKLADSITAAVREGLDPDRAAVACGLTVEQHDEWMTTARAALAATRKPTAREVKLIAHAQKLDQSMALAELDALQMVRMRADGWQAYRWILERRFADRWAKTPAAVVTAKASADVSSEPGKAGVVVPEGKLAKLRREREERRAGAAG